MKITILLSLFIFSAGVQAQTCSEGEIRHIVDGFFWQGPYEGCIKLEATPCSQEEIYHCAYKSFGPSEVKCRCEEPEEEI